MGKQGHRAIGAHDDIVLPGSAIPFGKMQFPVAVLHNAGRAGEMLGDIAVGSGSIAVPA